MSEAKRSTVLLFDGDCSFCSKSAALGRRFGFHCEFTPLQSVDLESLGIDPARAQHEVALLDGQRGVLYGHEAIAAVLRTGALPLRVLGYVITFKTVNRLSAFVYQVVSRHRHQLPGGSAQCKVETYTSKPSRSSILRRFFSAQ